jgi:hypothetical protein
MGRIGSDGVSEGKNGDEKEEGVGEWLDMIWQMMMGVGGRTGGVL